MGDVSYVCVCGGGGFAPKSLLFYRIDEERVLTGGPRKLASVGITGNLIIAMKDRHQFWVQIHEGCHAVFSALTPTFGIWP